jgi:hypothetical protein
MIKLTESHSLIPVKCYYNSEMDCFVFKVDGKTVSLKGASDEDLARVFRKSQMKDEETEPRSARGKTYMEMVQSIKNGTDHTNYIWNNFVSVFLEGLQSLSKSYQGA